MGSISQLLINLFWSFLEGKMYDPDGFWLRAAAVCIRDESESEVRREKSKIQFQDSWPSSTTPHYKNFSFLGSSCFLIWQCRPMDSSRRKSAGLYYLLYYFTWSIWIIPWFFFHNYSWTSVPHNLPFGRLWKKGESLENWDDAWEFSITSIGDTEREFTCSECLTFSWVSGLTFTQWLLSFTS